MVDIEILELPDGELEALEEWQRQEHAALQDSVARAYELARRVPTRSTQEIARESSLHERMLRGLVNIHGEEGVPDP